MLLDNGQWKGINVDEYLALDLYWQAVKSFYGPSENVHRWKMCF